MPTVEGEEPRVTAVQNIGSSIRAARQIRGISLRELARQIGVSASFVSQLENGKANASVGTLYALVDALDLSLDELMSGSGGNPADRDERQARSGADAQKQVGIHVSQLAPVTDPVQPRDERAAIRFPGVEWERLTRAADPLVDFLHVRYEPGGASCAPDDMMRHGGREYGYILTGLLHVQVGFDHYDLAPGDAVTFDSMTPHRLSNPYDDPVQAVWMVIGRRDDERGQHVEAPGSGVTHLPSMPM